MPNNGVKTQAMIQAESELGDRTVDALLYSKLNFLSNTVRRWWDHADPVNPNKIVMIRHKDGKGDAEYGYYCYASDARKLSRAIGISIQNLELQGIAIPYIRMDLCGIDMYRDQLSSLGITLELTWNPRWGCY